MENNENKGNGGKMNEEKYSRRDNARYREVDYAEVREVLDKAMSQEEFAKLARVESGLLGLRRAKNVNQGAVSKFVNGELPRGHVHEAILSAVEKHLKIENLFVEDVA